MLTEPGCLTKETVVFLHGFGGSSATYHPFLTELADHYDVYAIDLLGMGCSGKPDINYQKLTAEQVIELFVESLKQWFDQMQIGPFRLVAHSLGAYFASFYLARNDSRAVSFCSISLAGAAREPQDFSEVMKQKKLPFKRKAMYWFWSFMNQGYIKGHTAFSLLPMESLIHSYSKGRIGFEGEEKKSAVKYLSAMFWDKNFSADIITRIFKYRAYAKIPVSDVMHLVEQKVDCTHIWGDQDWQDKFTFNKFVQDSSLLSPDGLKSKVVFMENCGHQIPNVNPQQLVAKINEIYGKKL